MNFLFVILFISVYAENNEDICAQGMYFSLEKHDCEEISTECNQTTNEAHSFYGCTKCDKDYYRFKGDCIKCTCSSTADCINDYGCSSCNAAAKRYYRYETKYIDGSVRYDCYNLEEGVSTSDQVPLHERYGFDTIQNCEEYDGFGCIKCTGKNTLINGLCIPNSQCTKDENDADVTSTTVNLKCTNCAEGHYLLNGICTPCDSNCAKCNVTTGECEECSYQHYSLGGKRCYACDPNCDIEHCVNPTENNDTTCTKCMDGYYLIDGKYCLPCPYLCSQCETNRGCVACKDYNESFLIPYDYLGENKFHYNISFNRIGLCIPHQDVCLEPGEDGCLKCPPNTVMDNVTWTGVDGKQYTRHFCSGASNIFVLVMIVLLVLVMF